MYVCKLQGVLTLILLGYPVCILLESCILICSIWISVFWCFSWNSGKTRRVCQRCSFIPTNPGPWENLAQKSDRSKVESHHHCISQSKYFALLLLSGIHLLKIQFFAHDAVCWLLYRKRLISRKLILPRLKALWEPSKTYPKPSTNCGEEKESQKKPTIRTRYTFPFIS